MFQKPSLASGSLATDISARLISIFCTLLLLLSVRYACAEPSEQTAPHRYESLGLYKTRKDGGLGPELWKNSRRSAVQDYIQAMPVFSRSPTLQKLSLSLLLSAGNIAQMENDSEPLPGEDILTLRLQKLIDMGAYHKAYELYNLLPKKPYHTKVAKLGILSMLYSGEKALACLESHALREYFEIDGFWEDITAYCTYTLSDSQSEEKKSEEILKRTNRKILRTLAFDDRYNFTYNPVNIDKLTPLEKAVLSAESRINIKSLGESALLKVPTHHIEVLLAQDNLSTRQEIILNVLAVRYGIKTPNDLATVYETVQIEPAEAGAAEKWEELPLLFRSIKRAQDKSKKWALLKQMLTLLETYGAAALTPFAKTLANDTPEEASLEEVKNAFLILLRAGAPPPPRWIDLLYKHRATHQTNPVFFALANIAHISNPGKYSDEFEGVAQLNRGDHIDFTKKILFFTENVRRKHRSTNGKGEIYEKDFYLTSPSRYVMPSVQVWDRFIDAGQKRSLGETVLLSIMVLQENSPGTAYPGIFRDVLVNFNNVGLTDVAESLAFEAIVESIGKRI